MTYSVSEMPSVVEQLFRPTTSNDDTTIYKQLSLEDLQSVVADQYLATEFLNIDASAIEEALSQPGIDVPSEVQQALDTALGVLGDLQFQLDCLLGKLGKLLSTLEQL
jgi:hypothetical protein